VILQSIDRVCTTPCLHDDDYRMTRLRGPLHGPHIADRLDQRTDVPAFGRPAFLPAASGGVSSRRIA
jgi:hypothetical protein